MAKKEFFSSFEKNLSLDNGSTATATTPNTKTTDITNITKKADITKVTTFRIKVDVLEKIHAIAYWERQKIQDVLDNALTSYIDSIPAKDMEKAIAAYTK